MNQKIAIKCSHLYKRYPLYSGGWQRLKGLFLNDCETRYFTALKDINVDFYEGEIIGIIGLNGSGKSTLAHIITGITHPSEGTVTVDGEVSMLAVNSGMQDELTGLENIRYKCLLLGIHPRHIEAITPEIVEFADLGEFIGQPLRTYSSGMRARLGFAISVFMDPDILIIDEALSVGDGSFADKCRPKIEEFKDSGKTILYVSHSVMQMQNFCDRVMWLHRGVVLGIAKPEEILIPYCGFTRECNAMTSEERRRLVPSLQSYQKKYL